MYTFYVTIDLQWDSVHCTMTSCVFIANKMTEFIVRLITSYEGFYLIGSCLVILVVCDDLCSKHCSATCSVGHLQFAYYNRHISLLQTGSYNVCSTNSFILVCGCSLLHTKIKENLDE